MKLVTVLLAGAALAVPGIANAAYLPTGPQTNVNIATVTGGGWTQCYGATMAVSLGNSAATALAGCTGSRIMLAGRETGSSTLLVLAQTLTADALFNTGAADNGIFHNADGSDWFNADGWSWGFKTPGSSYNKFQCDTSPPPEPSMCLHTIAGVGGHAINQIAFLNGSTAYEKLVFTFTGAAGVPEPATWGMMILGFAMVGAAMRRSKTETRVRYAF